MALLLFYFLTLAGIICCQEVIKMRVKEDEDVILPCSFDSTNIRNEVFDWKKDDQKNVFLYSSGSHYNNGRSGQDPQFKGRVFHFEDQLQSGNASIEIRKTKVTDSGNYRCIFPFHQPEIRSIIELIVGSCPKPSVTNLGQTDDQALLQCEVRGVFPKPKVQWLDSENKTVPAEEPQETKSEGKYNIILKTTVTKSDVYRCVSTQEGICHQIHQRTIVALPGGSSEEKIKVIKMRVKEDEDVILPCSLDSTNIRTDVFDWKKDDQNVFLYSSGSHYNNGRGGQDPQFKGRVFHFEDQLQSGDASIEIRKTTKTDSGNYSCIFPFHQPEIRSIIELIVDCVFLKDRTEEKIAGSSPKPCVTNLGQTNDQAQLQCEVQDAFPKPKVQWLDSENKTVPAEEPQETESEGKYNIILKTTVKKSDVYRCVSTQEEICHQIDRTIKVSLSDKDPEFSYELCVAVAISDAVLLLIYGILYVPKIRSTIKWFKQLYYGLLMVALVSGATVSIFLALFVKETHTRINSNTELYNALCVAVSVFTPVLLLIYGILLVPKMHIFLMYRFKLYYGVLAAILVLHAIVSILFPTFVKETCTRIHCSTEYGLIVVVVLGVLLVLGDIFQQIFTIVKRKHEGAQQNEYYKPWIFFQEDVTIIGDKKQIIFQGELYVSSADFNISEDMKTLFQQNDKDPEGIYIDLSDDDLTENSKALDQRNDKDPATTELEAAIDELKAARAELEAAGAEVDAERVKLVTARTVNHEAGQQDGPQQPMMPTTDATARLPAARVKLKAERAKLKEARAKLQEARTVNHEDKDPGDICKEIYETMKIIDEKDAQTAEHEAARAELKAATAELRAARAELKAAREDIHEDKDPVVYEDPIVMNSNGS